MNPLPRVLAFTPPRGPVDAERVHAIDDALRAELGLQYPHVRVALVLRTPGQATPPSDPRVAEASARASDRGWSVWGSTALAGAERAGTVDAYVLRRAAEWPDAPGLWGRSVHLGDHTDSSAAFDCFAPVFSPRTDPRGKAPAGLGALRAYCKEAPRPVYALGGITAERVRPCFEAGAYGIAAIGALFGPEADLSAFGAAIASSLRTFFG